MKVLNFLGIFSILTFFYSCDKQNLGNSKTIVVNKVTIDEYEFKQFSYDPIDSVMLHIFYTDPGRKAVWFGVFDSRWDSIPPRYYSIPVIPSSIDIGDGLKGVLEVPILKNDIYVVDSQKQNKFVYQVEIYAEDSVYNSQRVDSDTIIVRR